MSGSPSSSSIEVDVIVPVRDVDWFLEEALNSVLAQAGVMCHVIVVDDASRDPVQLPIPLRNHERVTLTRSSVHIGAGGARNLGISRGRSPLVTFLDADDLWAPRRTLALVMALGDQYAFASGRVDHFADTKKALPGLFVPPPGQHAILAGTTLIRRQEFEDLGGFTEDLHVGEFVDLIARGRSLTWKGARTDEVVLLRRVHSHHTSRQIAVGRASYLRVVRDQLRRQHEQGT